MAEIGAAAPAVAAAAAAAAAGGAPAGADGGQAAAMALINGLGDPAADRVAQLAQRRRDLQQERAMYCQLWG